MANQIDTSKWNVVQKTNKSRHKYKTTDSTAVALYKAKERSNLQLYTLLKRSSYLEARFSAANPYST